MFTVIGRVQIKPGQEYEWCGKHIWLRAFVEIAGLQWEDFELDGDPPQVAVRRSIPLEAWTARACPGCGSCRAQCLLNSEIGEFTDDKPSFSCHCA